MSFENLVQFFKKNSVLLIQITVLSLPIIIFVEYFSISENSDSIDPVSLAKVETESTVKQIEKVEKDNSAKNKNTATQSDAASFEVDEVSQEMLDKNAGNPKEMLSANSPCKSFEDIKTLAIHTGTISKAKNSDNFPRPLPAIITETEYVCVDQKGARQTKFTVTGVAADSASKVLRCIQSNSDETLNREARFRLVLKTMTHHCGFKLSEHHAAK